MTKFASITSALAIAAVGFPAAADAASTDEARIRALEAQYVAACNARDINAIMKVYVPDDRLVAFDATLPRQFVGAQAFRKDWDGQLAKIKGPLKVELIDLAIAVDRTLAYSHSIQHLTGTDTSDHPIDVTVRVTDVYRKIKGQWLIEHEHISVPIDPNTGKPEFASKP
jgi:uncharacterized protein (TIGR02246 family)